LDAFISTGKYSTIICNVYNLEFEHVRTSSRNLNKFWYVWLTARHGLCCGSIPRIKDFLDSISELHPPEKSTEDLEESKSTITESSPMEKIQFNRS
jgi:hypothetical protein